MERGAVAPGLGPRAPRPAPDAARVALEPVEDGRIVSRWAMDVAFAYASIELDASNPTNWFETARIASQSLRDEGGSPLPSQVDVTIDLIPEA